MNYKVDKAKGKIQEVVGKTIGDRELETKGKINQTVASTRESIDKTVENTKQEFARKKNNVLDKMNVSNNE